MVFRIVEHVLRIVFNVFNIRVMADTLDRMRIVRVFNGRVIIQSVVVLKSAYTTGRKASAWHVGTAIAIL